MRYQEDIIINLPREKVVEIFDNPDNLSKWQPTLIKFEHIEGEAGQPGAKSRLVYKQGNGEMEMIETITTRNLPEEFTSNYEVSGVLNINRNYFHAISDTQTRWVTDTEFQFSNIMMKLMGVFMPFMFKRQTRTFMQDFKTFAEADA